MIHYVFDVASLHLHPTDEALLEDEIVEQPKSKR